MTKNKHREGLSLYSDAELSKELNRRYKKRRGPVLGYRAVFYGDEYDYGTYSNYLIGNYKYLVGQGLVQLDKKTAKKLAEESVENRAENGGCVETIYKHNLNPPSKDK